MRRTLSLSLVLSLLTTAAFVATTLPARPAEACGGSYVERMPNVMDMTWHVTSKLTANGRVQVTPRAFAVAAVSADPEPANATWTAVSSDMFESAHLTSETTLPRPLELTLVGPRGTRIVKVTRRALMRDPGPSPRLRWVYEVPVTAKDRGTFVYAIEGAHHDAAWTSADKVTLGADMRTNLGTRVLSGVVEVGGRSYMISRDARGVLWRTAVPAPSRTQQI